MSLNEESTIETEGEEIQIIGYETVLEVPQINNQEKSNTGIKENQENSKDLPVREIIKKKSKYSVEDVGVSGSTSSNYDICRICHMGNPTSNQNCANGETGNRISSPSLNLGLLVSACKCRGTVGLVHTKCLERWLTESGHTRCELCGYRYATIRVPRHGVLRSLMIWIRTFVATRQMFLDSLYLVVTTPLAVFSAYVCAMTLKMALENRIGEIPWTIVAMLPTCSLTLVAYWGWLLTLQRLHGRRWRQYWQSNFIVQLVPDSPIVDNQSNDELDLYRDDVYEDLQEFFNVD